MRNILWVSSVIRGLHVWHGSCITGWKWVIEFLVPCWDGCHGNWQSPPARCVWLSSVFIHSSLLLSAFLSLLCRPSYSYSNVAEVRSSSHGAEFHSYCFQRFLDNERSLQWIFVHFNHRFYWLLDHFSSTKRDTCVVQMRISRNLSKIFFFFYRVSTEFVMANSFICQSIVNRRNCTMKWSVLAQKRENCCWDFPHSIHGLIVGYPIGNSSPSFSSIPSG